MNQPSFNQIRELLDRYYMGETSVEEEKQLSDILADTTLDIPAELQADVEMFREMNGIKAQVNNYRDQEAEMHTPLGFEKRLQATIDKLAEAEETEAKSDEDPVIGHSATEKQPPRIGYYLRRAAACAIVAVVLGIGYFNLEQPAYTDTCKTPEEAEMQMNRALALLNSKSQQGVDEAFESLGNGRSATQQSANLNKFISFQ